MLSGGGGGLDGEWGWMWPFADIGVVGSVDDDWDDEWVLSWG